jgi:hypothetical protein
MKNERVYLHEYIDIILHHRADYFEHMTTGWAHGQAELNQRTFGVWGSFGSTGRWPEVVNLWEYDSIEHMAADYKHETSGKNMQNPTLYEWWSRAQSFRSGGWDRILYPADYSPGIEELCAKGTLKHRVYCKERINITPGQSWTYLDMLGEHYLPVAAGLGMDLIGAYSTALRNDSEVFVIWGLKTWKDWARIEQEQRSEKVQAWRAKTAGIAEDWVNLLMCNAPQSPLETGHQPRSPSAAA